MDKKIQFAWFCLFYDLVRQLSARANVQRQHFYRFIGQRRKAAGSKDRRGRSMEI